MAEHGDGALLSPVIRRKGDGGRLRGILFERRERSLVQKPEKALRGARIGKRGEGFGHGVIGQHLIFLRGELVALRPVLREPFRARLRVGDGAKERLLPFLHGEKFVEAEQDLARKFPLDCLFIGRGVRLRRQKSDAALHAREAGGELRVLRGGGRLPVRKGELDELRLLQGAQKLRTLRGECGELESGHCRDHAPNTF